jgi:hypothetical protein
MAASGELAGAACARKRLFLISTACDQGAAKVTSGSVM